MVLATVVSALAALGALWFARDTVRETRAMRREERLARLPELVAHLGIQGFRPGQHPAMYNIPRAQLAAMLVAVDDPLPACRALATDAAFDNPALDHHVAVRIEQQAHAALAELAELSRVG